MVEGVEEEERLRVVARGRGIELLVVVLERNHVASALEHEHVAVGHEVPCLEQFDVGRTVLIDHGVAVVVLLPGDCHGVAVERAARQGNHVACRFGAFCRIGIGEEVHVRHIVLSLHDVPSAVEGRGTDGQVDLALLEHTQLVVGHAETENPVARLECEARQVEVLLGAQLHPFVGRHAADVGEGVPEEAVGAAASFESAHLSFHMEGVALDSAQEVVVLLRFRDGDVDGEHFFGRDVGVVAFVVVDAGCGACQRQQHREVCKRFTYHNVWFTEG